MNGYTVTRTVTRQGPQWAVRGLVVNADGFKLPQRPLFFVAHDLMGEKLIEVNITSPTGIQELGRFLGRPVEDDVIAWVEARAGA